MNIIKDSNSNIIKREWPNGVWIKYKYNDNGKEIYKEWSGGKWVKYYYDNYGNYTHLDYGDDGVFLHRKKILKKILDN